MCFESISITHAAITDQAGLSHINTESFKQEEVQHELNQIITNGFDKEQALTELGAQVNITTEFDNKRRAIRSEFAKKAEDYRKQAEELPQGSQERTKLEAKAKQIDDNLRLFDGITSALYAPNSNGIIGDVARAASPELAYQIGQYFKENKLKNEIDGGNRPEEQSANHLLAHAILGAAVSYATGNNPTTGALAGAGSEAFAPMLSNYLYDTKDPETLTQEQKDTITSIITLANATAPYSATGDVGSAVSAGEVAKGAVENNAVYINKGKAIEADQNRANEMAKDIISDRNAGWRFLRSKRQADLLYQLNTSKDLEVQVDVNDLGELKITGDSWKTLPDGRQTIIVRPTTYNVWAVTGSLTLVRRTDGTYGVFNDTYDFEMHNSGILAIPRNIETVVGSPRCAATSGCTGYQIKFNGNFDKNKIKNLKGLQ